MNKSFVFSVVAIGALALLLFSCEKDSVTPPSQVDALTTFDKKPAATAGSFTVFAKGLNNPRGLRFGPDGYLYVAEGGLGGSDSTTGECTQVVPPVGPYKGGMTGRISKVSPTGAVTTVIDSLPSDQTSATEGSLVSGVADVEFVGNTLYALLAGAGCSHGVPSVPNGIIRINSDATRTLIADLSAWQQAHPVAHPEPDDFEPDGTWYSMINVRGDLYAVEPNHGEMVRVTTAGDISRVTDFSASYGHIVPTAVAYHGNFFVGNLHPFPIVDGSSSLYKVTPSGQSMVWATGFTTILGVAIDQQRRIYVLENTTCLKYRLRTTGGWGRTDCPRGCAVGQAGIVCVTRRPSERGVFVMRRLSGTILFPSLVVGASCVGPAAGEITYVAIPSDAKAHGSEPRRVRGRKGLHPLPYKAQFHDGISCPQFLQES